MQLSRLREGTVDKNEEVGACGAGVGAEDT